jgi:hypothetical protein
MEMNRVSGIEIVGEENANQKWNLSEAFGCVEGIHEQTIS